MRFWYRLIPLAIAGFTLCGRAVAQPSAADQASARKLFNEAVAAMNKRDYETACPNFRAAMLLYPSPSTQIYIAQCFEHEGKLASAWAAYQRALVLNRDTKEQRRREALEKIAADGSAALEAKLPKIRILVPVPVPGLKVTQDEQDVPPTSFGVPLPVDSGAHTIEATAPGYNAWKQIAMVEQGKTIEVTVALHVVSTAADASPEPRGGPGAPLRQPDPAEPPREPKLAPATAALQREPASTTAMANFSREAKSGIPVWAWAVGGAGVAVLALSVGFRADWGSVDAKQEAAGCGESLQRCPRTYITLDADNARKDRDRALFVGLGAAGVGAIGAGIVGIVIGSVKKRAPAGVAVRAVPWTHAQVIGAALEGKF